MSQNKLSKGLSRVAGLPPVIKNTAISFMVGRKIPYAGSSGITIEKMEPNRVIASLQNKRKVGNHIGGIHAAAMALIAESATGLVMAMNVPDDCVLVIKTMNVNYRKRTQGAMKAEAHLSPEQQQQIASQNSGEISVPVTVTDETGNSPIECEMIWAWRPKKRQ